MFQHLSFSMSDARNFAIQKLPCRKVSKFLIGLNPVAHSDEVRSILGITVVVNDRGIQIINPTPAIKTARIQIERPVVSHALRHADQPTVTVLLGRDKQPSGIKFPTKILPHFQPELRTTQVSERLASSKGAADLQLDWSLTDQDTP